MAQAIFDKRFHSLPPIFGSEPMRIGGAAVQPQTLVVLVGASTIVLLLWLFIDRTLLGKAVIATAVNRLAARLVGINTSRIVGLSFAVSAAIGATAGLLATPITLTSYDVGTLLALKGFAAAMLGGIGSALGAALGGLVLGMLEAFSAGYLSSKYKDAVAFVVLLAALLAMPRGLLGRGSRASVNVRTLIAHRLAGIAIIGAIIIVLPPFFPSAYYYRGRRPRFDLRAGGDRFNPLMGFAGQVSLGHAGFLGIGGYSVAIGPTYLGTPPWLCILGGAALSSLVAFFVGRPILRLKDTDLAVATLGFGVLVTIVLTNEAAWTGGPDGMTVPRLMLFGWSARGADAWYWIAAVTFIIGATLALNLSDSPTGRALQAIQDSEVAASTLGIDVSRQKLAIFVISAVFVSVAGSYLALFNGHLTPDVSGFLRSIELVAMVVLGGMGSVVGSLVGATVLVVLPQTLTVLHEYEDMVLGLILMSFMIFLRQGIVPSLMAMFARRRT